MKNYLLTLAIFGLITTTFSCSESEKDIDPTDEIEDNNNSKDDNDVDGGDNSDNDSGNDDQSELVLTDCLVCPGYTLEQTTASGNNVTITVEAADVCKGENGKAYLDGILNEDFETYELYLQNRQMFARCN